MLTADTIREFIRSSNLELAPIRKGGADPHINSDRIMTITMTRIACNEDNDDHAMLKTMMMNP